MPARLRFAFGGLRLLFDSVILALVLLLGGFFFFVAGIPRAPVDPPHADGISVLTGGSERIKAALSLLAEGKGARLLISGVNRDTTRAQLKEVAANGQQYFTCCVDLDREAKNTIDNATETGEWAAAHHYRSVIVVTSNYHMPRALAELGRTMTGVKLIPYAVVDRNVYLDRWWLHAGSTRLLLSEYLKYLPAVARLGATRAVNRWIYGRHAPQPADVSGP